MSKCGGLSQEKTADAESIQLLKEAYSKISACCEKKFGSVTSIELISYRTQVVAGIYYFLRILVDGTTCWIKVYKPLPSVGGELQVIGIIDAEEIEQMI
ncbi:hypothetical protein HZS_580 [Henneguya salminicola]|nr:hypothetical protein HZS_580 [Henneguya salminicola]